MTTPNDFSEYYKTIGNAELLNILDNPENYQPMAVEAAKAELVNRQLSHSEIKDARQTLDDIQAKKEELREKVKAVELKAKAAADTFFDTINPIQSGLPSTEKTIRFIVITFGCIFLYQFITGFHTHIAYIRDIPRFPFLSIMYLCPQILLPIATFTFWKRKPLGWLLLTIFVTSSAVAAVGLLYESLTWKPSGFPNLDRLLPRVSPSTYIIQLAFLIGSLVALSRPDIRDVFAVNKKKAGVTIGVTVLSTYILMLVIS